MAKNFRILQEEFERELAKNPARFACVQQERQAADDAFALAQLRERCGQTQVQLAEKLATTQRNISRIEHAENLYVSALREYVEALGGELEIAAVFPDGRVVLTPPAKSSRKEKATS
jgi:DNA-binding XRE family transcriptional regulator